jgi:asparagine synthase (glutamine-hydrolysing)
VSERVFREYTEEILKSFDEVIQDYYADSILLSGGLDTSIIASLVSQYFKPQTVSVGFSGSNASDIYYARIVAEQFALQNYVKLFNLEEATEAAEYVVKTLKTFDPMEIRNDITIYIGMKYLKETGVKSVITGDGSDELFAGYSFLFKLKPREVDKWINDITEFWSFAAKPIGESLGLNVLQPFLDERIIELALKIPAELKIAEHNGVIYGKYVLRRAFEKFLSNVVVWRPKEPIETGSGSVELTKLFKVTPEEFSGLSKIVRLDSQEQAYYFKIYCEKVGTIPKPKADEKACPRCSGGVPSNKNYCKICGAYPVQNQNVLKSV